MLRRYISYVMATLGTRMWSVMEKRHIPNLKCFTYCCLFQKMKTSYKSILWTADNFMFRNWYF